MNLFNNNIKFMHFRNFADGKPTSRGGVTVAYYIDNFGEIRYAFSRCSDKDNFCKHTGRTYAVSRLKEAIQYGEVPPALFRSAMNRFVKDVYGYARQYSKKRERKVVKLDRGGGLIEPQMFVPKNDVTEQVQAAYA